MPNISLSWGNTLKDFQKTLKETNNNIDKEIEKVLRQTANEILSEVKRYTPKETGKLARNWKTVRKNDKEFEIENDLNYAYFVENGTRYMVPKRMLARAIANGRKRLKRRLDNIMKKTKQGFEN